MGRGRGWVQRLLAPSAGEVAEVPVCKVWSMAAGGRHSRLPRGEGPRKQAYLHSPFQSLPPSGTHNPSTCPGWLLSWRAVVPPGPFMPFLGAFLERPHFPRRSQGRLPGGGSTELHLESLYCLSIY